MADLSKIKLNNVEYDLKDSQARNALENKEDKFFVVTYTSQNGGQTYVCNKTYNEIISAIGIQHIIGQIIFIENNTASEVIQTATGRMHADVIEWTFPIIGSSTTGAIIEIEHDSNDNINVNQNSTGTPIVIYTYNDNNGNSSPIFTCNYTFQELTNLISNEIVFSSIITNSDTSFVGQLIVESVSDIEIQLNLIQASTGSSVDMIEITHRPGDGNNESDVIRYRILSAPCLKQAISLPEEFQDDEQLWLVDEPILYYGNEIMPATFIKCSSLPNNDIIPLTINGESFNFYYLSSNNIQGYVSNELASQYELQVGFYTITQILALWSQINDSNAEYIGVISDCSELMSEYTEESHDNYGLMIYHNFYIHDSGNKYLYLGGPAISLGSGTNSIIINDNIRNEASGVCSFVHGYKNEAAGAYSHAEGHMTNAMGYASHSEGSETGAYGYASHAEGGSGGHNGAYGDSSHVEGTSGVMAYGAGSHAEGEGTVAHGKLQHVGGRYNIIEEVEDEDDYGTYAEIIGNGDSSSHSNARTLDWNGNEILAGKLTIGVNPTQNMDVTTKQYVDNAILNSNNMIETTWANLVDLRDNEELKPGCFYRIINYNFITSKVNIHSGNHQFDIIVLAISESMLSETAYAARHSGDNYFEREVSTGGIEWLYTVYVDDYATNYGENIVDHADDIHSGDVFCDSGTMEHPTSGDIVPILYKTDSNEYDFDDPDYSDVYFYEGVYDFEGDDYDMWSKWETDENSGDLVFKSQYALTPIVVNNGELTVSPIPVQKAVSVNMNAWELKYCLDNDKTLFDWADTNGKGVIYYMKDEFGNEAPYDFKNAMFERRKITAVANSTILNSLLNKYLGENAYYNITCNANDKQYFYTFGIRGNNNDIGVTDGSLFGDNSYNIIKPYIYEGMRLINNIICAGSNNIFGNDCYDMTVIGTNNIFQINCMTNLLASVSQNHFDERVHHITVSQSSSCSFGKYSNSIMGTNITDSIIGDSCNNLNLGTGCSALKLGRGCSNNSFGNYCYNLTLGENVTTSQFGGNYCSYNTIGSFSSNIRITCNNIRYSTIEPNCRNITINTSNSSTYIQYVKICTGLTNLTVQPVRGTSYEQIWYKSGRVENAV